MIRKTGCAAVAAFLVGCGGSAGVQFAADPQVASSRQSLSSDTAPVAPITFSSNDGMQFELKTARVNLRDIQVDLTSKEKCEDVKPLLAAPAECKGESTIIMRGPFVVDLATGVSTPDLSTARIPAGTYRRIDFRLDDTKDGEGVAATDPLYTKSFHAEAAFTHEGNPATLVVSLKINEDLRVERPEGVTLDGTEGELLVLMQPAQWLEGIPVADCLAKKDVVVENGILRLDDNASGGCSAAEGVLKENLKRSMDLRKHD